MSADRYFYVVTRADLAPGQHVAQAVHAASEWVLRYGQPPTHVQARVATRQDLLALHLAAQADGAPSAVFREPDPAHGGPGVTAVALAAARGAVLPASVRSVLRRLPFALAEDPT